ncbi:MAG: type IV toxin-antitoxin system AbiEi family antitoxin [Candidatus Wallbacteria bacterium]|nr:type IV toxin-antitoxin system AbiEi family antitoxin [Candidatus Wallbacteria bacterium]
MSKIPETFAAILGVTNEQLDFHRTESISSDLTLKALGMTFQVNFIINTSAANINSTIQYLQQHQIVNGKSDKYPLIAAAYMGEVGRKVCEQNNIGWFDLSGNAHIIAPKLRIIISGNRNQFLNQGRPANLFAPKSSRVTRWLLLHHEKSFTQREISRATYLDEGFVSRIVTRLLKDGYLQRNNESAVKPKDPELLLSSWRESYKLDKHIIIRGHAPARSGDELLKKIAEISVANNAKYAATGLAAAWAYTKFSGFRICSIYVEKEPDQTFYEKIGFRKDPRGANLWLLIPNDTEVFLGEKKMEDINCVHPLQVYLDLKAHPERSEEVASELKNRFLNWKNNA